LLSFRPFSRLCAPGDGLRMIDHEAVAGNEIPQTILQPSYYNRSIT
jgi:hypothetical protein